MPIVHFEALEGRVHLAATPAGTYEFGKDSSAHVPKIVIEDADGTLATFTLGGRGTASVVVSDSGWDLTIASSLPSPALNVKALGGDGLIVLRNVSATDVARFNAPAANLAGSGVFNAVKVLTLRDIESGGSLALASANSIKLAHVRGSLDVSGSVKSLTVADYVAASQVTSATGGTIHVGGSTKIKSAGERFSFSNHTVYACTADMYTPRELFHYDEVGSVRQYDETNVESGTVEKRIATVSILPGTDDTVQPNWLERDEDAEQNVDVTTWHDDGTGAYQYRDLHTDADSTTDISYSRLPVAPPLFRLKQRTIGEPANTIMHYADSDAGIDLNGESRGESYLAGHQMVTTPAGTFLAAKIILTKKLDADGFIFHQQHDPFPYTFHAKGISTIFAAPGVGIVSQADVVTSHTNVSPRPRRARITSVLVQYTPGTV